MTQSSETADRNAEKQPTEAVQHHRNRRTMMAAAIVGALITAGATIWVYLSGRGTTKSDRINGLIVSTIDGTRIRGAKVSVEAEGIPPVVHFSDSEGIFDIPLPAGTQRVRVRIDASGFVPYDRQSDRATMTRTEEFRLDPVATPPSSPAPKRQSQKPSSETRFEASVLPPKTDGPPPAGFPSATPSLLDPALPLNSGPSAPWAVTIFGEHQERRSDVTSWVRSALHGSGRDTIGLFRKASDEQREAPRLYSGNASLFREMNAGRHCSNILVAKLSVVSFGSTDGLAVAEARLAVHVLSPDGELLKQFTLTEKGGGGDDDAAKRQAIDQLEAVIQNELPEAIG